MVTGGWRRDPLWPGFAPGDLRRRPTVGFRYGGTAPDGVDAAAAARAAMWTATAMANATTASGPSDGSAAACASVSVPANAAARMVDRSHVGSAAVVTPDYLHDPPESRNPYKRRTSLQTAEVLRRL